MYFYAIPVRQTAFTQCNGFGKQDAAKLEPFYVSIIKLIHFSLKQASMWWEES